MGKSLGLYIHIPFCKSKCYYCDFNSFACRDELIPAYFNALKDEIKLYAGALRDFCIKTVFIGGGTPSLVNAHNIYEIVLMLKREFDLDKSAEITIEANPGTLTYEKLTAYRVIGINRLSIGLQACQDNLLKSLGRIHSVEEFMHNYELAKKVGFDNISIDLIFGIPDQSFTQWDNTLNYVIQLEPAHLSCYSLKIEEGTVFGNRLEAGELLPVDDCDDRDMYHHAIGKLCQRGYRHYEISNFAKDGLYSRHNLTYWKGDEYIGIGAGAHSFFHSERFNNIYDIESYIDGMNQGNIPRENIIFISEQDKMGEFMMLGLRLIDGVNTGDFEKRFNKDIFSVFKEQISKVYKKGLIDIEKDFIKLTPVGLDLANQVFMEFI